MLCHSREGGNRFWFSKNADPRVKPEDDKMKNKLLIICGPTATGKTALATMLAKRFNGELVSADSRQVYREMELVTGKDRPDVPVWLYDVASPEEEFSVNQWVKLAHWAIADIHGRNKLPIVVGGTGLYINALTHPFQTINIPPNPVLRKELSAYTIIRLQNQLQQLSPSVWQELNNSDRNNPRRLIRKIEIARSNIRPRRQAQQYDYLMIGLTAPKQVLCKLIDKRLEVRLRKGMETEAASLLARYNSSLQSMSAIGVNEHAYARRQLTWFRKQPHVSWFDITQTEYPDNVTEQVAGWYTKDDV